MNIDNEDNCFICCDKKYYLINSICHCKNQIHIECLIKQIKQTQKKYCTVCFFQYNIYLDLRNRIILPFNNIYFIPLLTNNIIILEQDNYLENLKYALINRIDDKIIQILENINNSDYIKLKSLIFPFCHETSCNIIHKNENNILEFNGSAFASHFKSDYLIYKKYIDNLFIKREEQKLMEDSETN